jgi:hypothetical protein
VFAVAVAGLFALPAAGLGQSPDPGDGIRGWVELGAGGGRVRLSGSPRETTFALDFGGGVWLGHRLGLGVRLGGWTIEGFDLLNAEEGESISEVFAGLAFRPRPDLPLTLNVESGWAIYTVNDPARVLREGDGMGWRLAGAWSFFISERLALSPSLVVSWGRINPNARSEGRFGYSGTGILLRLDWAW